MNKISIILVSHDRPEYLTEAINSMLSQTYPCWELLVMDYSNARYDEVKKVLDDFQKDKRIRVFYHREYDPKNISICWNEALDLMTGDYWGLLDDDDTKMPDFAQITTKVLNENPGIEAVAYGTKNIGTSGGLVPIQTSFSIQDLIAANRIGSGSIVYRKNVFETLGYFDPRMVYAEDWEYILRFCTLIGKDKIKFLPDFLIGYRWHADKRQYIDNYAALLNDCVTYMRNKKMVKQTEKAKYSQSTIVAIKNTCSPPPESIRNVPIARDGKAILPDNIHPEITPYI